VLDESADVGLSVEPGSGDAGGVCDAAEADGLAVSAELLEA